MRHVPLILTAFVIVVVTVIFAPLVIDFAKTDPDRHGRIDVPGARVVDLPGGEVGVYYGERRTLPSRRVGNSSRTDPLPVPSLAIRAVRVGGGAEGELRPAFGVQLERSGRTTKQFAVLDVPEGGDYRVSVRSTERIRFPDPALSLGTDSTDETEFAPADWLLENIRTVILLAVGLAIAFAVASSLRSRRGGGPPPGGGPSPGGGADVRL